MVGTRLAGALFLLLTAVPAAAQSVRGQLTDSITRVPIPGAFLTLVDEHGGERARTITNAAGEFLLTAPSAGTYRLRSKRIGFRPYVSRPLTLRDGEVISYQVVVDPIPVALANIVVEGERQCDVAAGASVAAVWEEIHEALAAVAWTSRLPNYWYDISHFQRDLTASGRRKGLDSLWRDVGYRLIPFKSEAPEELAMHGFVVAADDETGGWVYWAPDADVLVSDPFVRTHCFETKERHGEAGELIGLEFTPARGRSVSDITGTLWIDRSTAELRMLEYTYTRLPEDLVAPRAGGRVEFLRLPSGTWIVRDWVIRMPLAVLTQRPMAMGTFPQVVGFRETGGSAVEIKTRGGTVVYRSDSLAAALAAVTPATAAAVDVPAAPALAPIETPTPPPPAPTPALADQPARRKLPRNSSILTAEEFAGTTAVDAMALVREFRPSWLQSRGTMSIMDRTASDILVFLNGVRAGDLTRLRELRVDELRELRFLGAAEAQQRYGSGTAGGVIEVWTK